MAGFLGMRGTGDWATDQRPKSWREAILYLYPNGTAPLTAILSKAKSEKVDDPEFNWWTKTLPEQAATITGIYTDSGLTTAYTSGGAAGDTLYVKMSEADAGQFRPGHQVLLRDSDDYTVDVNAKVTAVTKNGASSYLTVKLLEDDDNSASHDLSDADRCLICGNVNEEGALIPSAVSYDPVKYFNYTQIFRTPLELTRTALRTRLRTGDAYKDAKREALELHSIEMEKAFIFGIATENTGSGGKPERTTGGVLSFIPAANKNDFSLNSSYSTKTWLEAGEEWLDSMLEQIFRYGRPEKLALVGSGALLGINRLAKANGQIQLQPKTVAYGIKVMEWITPFGTLYLKTHPLFSHEPSNRHSMLIVEPENLRFRYIDDTHFKPDPGKDKAGFNAYDGIKEEFLTEAGLEYHHPYTFGFLNGVGLDNVV